MTRAAGEGLRWRVAEHAPDLRVRRHAHDGHRRTPDGNRPADDRGVATELPLPERVAEDDLEVVVRLILLLEKVAAERRSDAQRPEVGPGDAIADDDFRLRVADRWRPAADRCPPLDRGRAISDVLDRLKADVVARAVAVALPDEREAIRIGVGQGTKEDGIDDAEDRRRGPDRESEREDRRGREGG